MKKKLLNLIDRAADSIATSIGYVIALLFLLHTLYDLWIWEKSVKQK